MGKKAKANGTNLPACVIEANSYYNTIVTSGKIAAGLVKEVEKYLRSQLNAAEAIGSLQTMIVPYDTIIKELVKATDSKVTAASLDLHKVIQAILYKIACEWQSQGKSRIPVLKAPNGGTGRLVTVKTEFFTAYYDNNTADAVKKDAAKEKAKTAKAKREADAAELEAYRSGKKTSEGVTDIMSLDGEQATALVLNLLALYYVDMDIKAISDAVEKAAHEKFHALLDANLAKIGEKDGKAIDSTIAA